jgi:hypothetical protein
MRLGAGLALVVFLVGCLDSSNQPLTPGPVDSSDPVEPGNWATHSPLPCDESGAERRNLAPRHPVLTGPPEGLAEAMLAALGEVADDTPSRGWENGTFLDTVLAVKQTLNGTAVVGDWRGERHAMFFAGSEWTGNRSEMEARWQQALALMFGQDAPNALVRPGAISDRTFFFQTLAGIDLQPGNQSNPFFGTEFRYPTAVYAGPGVSHFALGDLLDLPIRLIPASDAGNKAVNYMECVMGVAATSTSEPTLVVWNGSLAYAFAVETGPCSRHEVAVDAVTGAVLAKQSRSACDA